MPDKTLADLASPARTFGEIDHAAKRAASAQDTVRVTSRIVARSLGRAEITYLTWTGDGLLRHTVFVGLRSDKPASQVRREI